MSHFLWAVLPYITIVLFITVPIIRMAVRPFAWSTRASSLFSRGSLGVASLLMHWGLFLVLIGHLSGLFGGLLGSDGAIQFFFWVGLVGGVMLLLGSFAALIRRMVVSEVRAMSQAEDYLIHLFLTAIVGLALYQVVADRIFGIAYNASAWTASLWRLAPQPELMASASLITKLHIALALVFFAYFPFTKLVHMWTLPINYLVRPYQSMRTQHNRFRRQWELALRSDKSWLVYGLALVVVLFGVSAGLLGQASRAVATADQDQRFADNGQLMGKALYVSQCARCHGVSGDGEGPGAASPKFAVPPRDLQQGGFRFVSTTNGVASKEDIEYVIRYGLLPAGMPAFSELSDRQVRSLVDLVDAMRGEAKPGDAVTVAAAPEPSQELLRRGEKLYAQNCAACHGEQGAGDGPVQGLTDVAGHEIPPRDFTTGRLKTGIAAEQIYLRIAAGIPRGDGSYLMPAFHQTLSAEDIWAITYHIRQELIPARELHARSTSVHEPPAAQRRRTDAGSSTVAPDDRSSQVANSSSAAGNR